jgi:hypothetical protein
MSLRRIECKRTLFKTLLHLDAFKTSKTRKIALVSKNSIVLSSETEISSLSTLSDVEDLSLLRLNFFKISQSNSFKISQISQVVNALISSELVIFVAKTAATLVA